MASNSKTNINVDEVILNGILTMLDKQAQHSWIGTMTELDVALERVLGRKHSNSLPGSPGALRVAVNRVINRLRSRRVSVKFSRTKDHARTRLVSFAQ